MFFFLMIRRPPRSTQSRSSAASDVSKGQERAFVWVLESALVGKDVVHTWKFRLGDPLGEEVGVLLWFGDENHVVRLCGESEFCYADTVPEEIKALVSEGPPWYRGFVGAPKKKGVFHGGDPKVMSARGKARKQELAAMSASASSSLENASAVVGEVAAVRRSDRIQCREVSGPIVDGGVVNAFEVEDRMRCVEMEVDESGFVEACTGASGASFVDEGLANIHVNVSGLEVDENGLVEACPLESEVVFEGDAIVDIEVIVFGPQVDLARVEILSLAGDANTLSLEQRLAAVRARLEQSDSDSEERGGSVVHGMQTKYRKCKEGLPRDAWKRFTPEKIHERKCQARVCNGYRGGQCTKWRISPYDLCAQHLAYGDLKYGRVSGPIPEKALRELIRHADQIEEKAAIRALRTRFADDGASAAAEGAVAVSGVGVEGKRMQNHWYTRALMWHFARTLFDTAHGNALAGICDLSLEERRSCLKVVNDHLRCHKKCVLSTEKHLPK